MLFRSDAVHQKLVDAQQGLAGVHLNAVVLKAVVLFRQLVWFGMCAHDLGLDDRFAGHDAAVEVGDRHDISARGE